MYRLKNILLLHFFVLIFFSCTSKNQEPVLFETLTSKETGLKFANILTPSDSFNVFKYLYFYNGAGVGAGDFNNDGLIDLFFAGNQKQNKIFLNQGKLNFKDVTTEAKIPDDGGWSTGISVVDINNDGLLDIYVCRVGKFETLHGKNQFLICQGVDKNGIPFYKDEAAEYGLDFTGFSTQAAFFDYDKDGDLDMYLMNHSVHQDGTYGERKYFIGTYDSLAGDRVYRNDGDKKFVNVTKDCGINSSAIGYGLGLCVADINLDGWPDIYVGNDFHENDYMYINQHNGTFKEELNDHIMHTSEFSMGVDVADVNNDAYPEIISMDMLPEDPHILKRSLGEDEYNTFFMKIGYGYNFQYTRNNLQYNRGNGMFSETGLYSGIYATDWSWSALWMDFDNDGNKDLFIGNGIPKRLTDIDYVNYIANTEVQDQIRNNDLSAKDSNIISHFPEIKLPNKFFKNEGNLSFSDLQSNVTPNPPTFSNGALYADLDNDGDLDIVVNNIADDALVYKNTSNDTKQKPAVDIILHGDSANKNAIGARLAAFSGNKIYNFEKYPVHGFMGSMEIPLHVGLDSIKIDSSFLIWPDNSYEKININTNATARIEVKYKTGLPQIDYSLFTKFYTNKTNPVTDITKQTGLLYKHTENPFNEFDREPLIPFMVSRDGPALAVGDINNDGLDDVFIGSAKTYKPSLLIQTKDGKFISSFQPEIQADSMFEETDAVFADVNNDGFKDLVIADGGNEYYGNEVHQQPRVFINDGHENFSLLAHAFDSVFVTASCVAAYDFTGDGFVDLFIGGRAVPFAYGEKPRSYLLQNDGSGHFTDVTKKYCTDLVNPGFVRDAHWEDIDKDGNKDLLLATEWDGIYVFKNNKKSFEKKYITNQKGWWNFLLPVDIDNDGDMDFIAGNLGLNSRLKASAQEPVTLYYNDFDGNGQKEDVLTYYLQGRQIPFAPKSEFDKRLPLLKKKYLYATDFANASLEDIFGKEKLSSSQVYTADYFSNAVIINNGKFNFSVKALPWQAQLSQYRTATVVNANNDNLPDILLGGNFYENTVDMGRYDADFGTLLINKGNGNFECSEMNGLAIKGQVRHILPLHTAAGYDYILTRNNDSAMVIRFGK